MYACTQAAHHKSLPVLLMRTWNIDCSRCNQQSHSKDLAGVWHNVPAIKHVWRAQANEISSTEANGRCAALKQTWKLWNKRFPTFFVMLKANKFNWWCPSMQLKDATVVMHELRTMIEVSKLWSPLIIESFSIPAACVPAMDIIAVPSNALSNLQQFCRQRFHKHNNGTWFTLIDNMLLLLLMLLLGLVACRHARTYVSARTWRWILDVALRTYIIGTGI